MTLKLMKKEMKRRPAAAYLFFSRAVLYLGAGAPRPPRSPHGLLVFSGRMVVISASKRRLLVRPSTKSKVGCGWDVGGGWPIIGDYFKIVFRCFLWEDVVCKRPEAAIMPHPSVR